jgi:hypothetical protein
MARAFVPARPACAAFVILLLGGCSSLLGIDHEYERAEGSGNAGGEGGVAGGSSSSASDLPVTSAGSGGGAGGGPPVEDCLDNVDNDSDMAIDCADTDCAPGFECVPSAPPGWEGYFRVRTTPFPNANPSPCPDSSAPSTYFDTPAPASCTACSCGAWGGGQCSLLPLSFWAQSNNCAGSSMEVSSFLNDGDCYEALDAFTSGLGSRSAKITGNATVTNMGACPPSGGLLNASPLWANQDDVCGGVAPVGGGCAGTDVCVARGAGDYTGPACIRSAGSKTCPAEWSEEIEVAAGGSDGRSCSACQCGVSGAACSGGSYELYDTDQCDGVESIEMTSSSCVNISSLFDFGTGSVLPTSPQAVGGSCSPSGGAPTGSVTPQEVITFCCQ